MEIYNQLARQFEDSQLPKDHLIDVPPIIHSIKHLLTKFIGINNNIKHIYMHDYNNSKPTKNKSLDIHLHLAFHPSARAVPIEKPWISSNSVR